jgi:hypothetical protein
VVSGLDRSIAQGEINVRALVARFEEMLDRSTADRILGADVEKYGVM